MLPQFDFPRQLSFFASRLPIRIKVPTKWAIGCFTIILVSHPTGKIRLE